MVLDLWLMILFQKLWNTLYMIKKMYTLYKTIVGPNKENIYTYNYTHVNIENVRRILCWSRITEFLGM